MRFAGPTARNIGHWRQPSKNRPAPAWFIESSRNAVHWLLAVHLKRGTWDSARPIGPWLAAIVRNKVIDAFRRRGRRIDVPIDDVINSLATPEATADSDVKLLGRLLSQLKDNQREIVTAISLEGASVRQTADRVKMSEGAVRVALHRALRSLAALYRKGEG